MFCARRPSSSAHLTKCRACHGICTLSPLDADLTIRFAKTRHTARLKCCVYATQNGDGGLQSAAPATKNAAHLLETMQRYSRLPRETTPFAELTIGMAARTVANNCRRLHKRRANTPSTPQTPRVKMGTLATHSGMNPCLFFSKVASLILNYSHLYFEGRAYGWTILFPWSMHGPSLPISDKPIQLQTMPGKTHPQFLHLWSKCILVLIFSHGMHWNAEIDLLPLGMVVCLKKCKFPSDHLLYQVLGNMIPNQRNWRGPTFRQTQMVSDP